MKSFLIRTIVVTLGWMTPVFVLAQNDSLIEYTPLAPIPGYVEAGATDLATYVEGIFRFGITIAILISVVMIIAGGLEYMTSEAGGKKANAKNRITGAVTGLLLALASFLLLNTINPQLVSFNLRLTGVQTGTLDIWIYEKINGGFSPKMSFSECTEARDLEYKDVTEDNRPSCVIQPTIASTDILHSFTVVGGRYVFRGAEECKNSEDIYGFDLNWLDDCKPIQCVDCVDFPYALPNVANYYALLDTTDEQYRKAPCTEIYGESPNCRIKSSLAQALQTINEELGSTGTIDVPWFVRSVWPPHHASGPNDCAVNGHCILIDYYNEDTALENRFKALFEKYNLELDERFRDNLNVFADYTSAWVHNPTALVTDSGPNTVEMVDFLNTYVLVGGPDIVGDTYPLEMEVREQLKERGIGVNHGGESDATAGRFCTELGQSDCTTVGGLVDDTIVKLATLKNVCTSATERECPIIITGGTEWWAHGSRLIDVYENSAVTNHIPYAESLQTGGKTVDLRTEIEGQYTTTSWSTLDRFIMGANLNEAGEADMDGPEHNQTFTKNIGGATIVFTYERTGVPPHWHVEVR